MPRNKLKRYTGAEVAQPKSIAEQLLAGTKLGNLLYGKQETYKDGYNQERKDASFKESANGQLVQRMGETAKDVGGLVATGLAFGNPLTASNAMAPLITGSQAYWITHGINDGAQRIENIGEGMQNFVEDPSWQNAGAVVKEVPMLVLDVANALPVARTVIETSKNAIPAAQQAAQRVIGSVDNAITNATKQAVESGVVGVNELPAQLAARVTSTPTITSPILDRTVGIQNRVFTGDPVFPKTTWQIPAFNTNSAYRLTGQSQIDDMVHTGFVRPKSGKIKGGRINEVHWSAGNAKSGYNIQPGQYVLETPRGLVDGTSNAVGLNDLSHVWTTRNGKVVDVIDEIRPHMRTDGSSLSSNGAYTFYERPSTYFKDAVYTGTPGTYAGKEVPTWQLPKGQRNQPHNPTATEKVYSVLGRDPNVPTEGIDESLLNSLYGSGKKHIDSNKNLGSLYYFLKQHGVNTTNLTLDDLDKLFNARLNAIKTSSNGNYNIAYPLGNEAFPRRWLATGYDTEGVVGSIDMIGPVKRSSNMTDEIWNAYQTSHPGAHISMIRNLTRSDDFGNYYNELLNKTDDFVNRTPVRGVSTRMYDAGIPIMQQTYNGQGLMSGKEYLSPKVSEAVLNNHYPNKKIINNSGIRHIGQETVTNQPVWLLNTPSGRYTHIPTKATSFYPSAIKDRQITTNINHGSIFLEDGGKL